MYNEIILTIKDRIATITLNRPDYSNAFAKESYKEIRDAIAQCENDPDVGVVVFTGAGKHFSAGGDIKRFKGLIESKTYLQEESINLAGQMAIAVKRCKKPTVAMINGAAAGAGCSLALACDFRVMSPRSKLAMAFIKLGLSGDTCGLYFLEKLTGIAKTTEMMMLGEPIGGEQALALGLATVLTKDDDTLGEETLVFAARLANAPLLAIARQKQLMEQFYYADLDDYVKVEGKYMAECSCTADFAEAVDAFLEKRPVAFGKK